MAKEYMQICMEYPNSADIGPMRAHLFKIFAPCLTEHPDLRTDLAAKHMFEDLWEITQELKQRLLAATNNAQIYNPPAEWELDSRGLRILPTWICQPHFRPELPQDSGAPSQSNEGASTSESGVLDEVAQARIRRKEAKLEVVASKKGGPFMACLNVGSTKCAFSCCKTRCRAKAVNERISVAQNGSTENQKDGDLCHYNRTYSKMISIVNRSLQYTIVLEVTSPSSNEFSTVEVYSSATISELRSAPELQHFGAKYCRLIHAKFLIDEAKQVSEYFPPQRSGSMPYRMLLLPHLNGGARTKKTVMAASASKSLRHNPNPKGLVRLDQADKANSIKQLMDASCTCHHCGEGMDGEKCPDMNICYFCHRIIHFRCGSQHNRFRNCRNYGSGPGWCAQPGSITESEVTDNERNRAFVAQMHASTNFSAFEENDPADDTSDHQVRKNIMELAKTVQSMGGETARRERADLRKSVHVPHQLNVSTTPGAASPSTTAAATATHASPVTGTSTHASPATSQLSQASPFRPILPRPNTVSGPSKRTAGGLSKSRQLLSNAEKEAQLTADLNTGPLRTVAQLSTNQLQHLLRPADIYHTKKRKLTSGGSPTPKRRQTASGSDVSLLRVPVPDRTKFSLTLTSGNERVVKLQPGVSLSGGKSLGNSAGNIERRLEWHCQIEEDVQDASLRPYLHTLAAFFMGNEPHHSLMTKFIDESNAISRSSAKKGQLQLSVEVLELLTEWAKNRLNSPAELASIFCDLGEESDESEDESNVDDDDSMDDNSNQEQPKKTQKQKEAKKNDSVQKSLLSADELQKEHDEEQSLTEDWFWKLKFIHHIEFLRYMECRPLKKKKKAAESGGVVAEADNEESDDETEEQIEGQRTGLLGNGRAALTLYRTIIQVFHESATQLLTAEEDNRLSKFCELAAGRAIERVLGNDDDRQAGTDSQFFTEANNAKLRDYYISSKNQQKHVALRSLAMINMEAAFMDRSDKTRSFGLLDLRMRELKPNPAEAASVTDGRERIDVFSVLVNKNKTSRRRSQKAKKACKYFAEAIRHVNPLFDVGGSLMMYLFHKFDLQVDDKLKRPVPAPVEKGYKALSRYPLFTGHDPEKPLTKSTQAHQVKKGYASVGNSRPGKNMHRQRGEGSMQSSEAGVEKSDIKSTNWGVFNGVYSPQFALTFMRSKSGCHATLGAIITPRDAVDPPESICMQIMTWIDCLAELVKSNPAFKKNMSLTNMSKCLLKLRKWLFQDLAWLLHHKKIEKTHFLLNHPVFSLPEWDKFCADVADSEVRHAHIPITDLLGDGIKEAHPTVVNHLNTLATQNMEANAKLKVMQMQMEDQANLIQQQTAQLSKTNKCLQLLLQQLGRPPMLPSHHQVTVPVPNIPMTTSPSRSIRNPLIPARSSPFSSPSQQLLATNRATLSSTLSIPTDLGSLRDGVHLVVNGVSQELTAAAYLTSQLSSSQMQLTGFKNYTVEQNPFWTQDNNLVKWRVTRFPAMSELNGDIAQYWKLWSSPEITPNISSLESTYGSLWRSSGRADGHKGKPKKGDNNKAMALGNVTEYSKRFKPIIDMILAEKARHNTSTPMPHIFQAVQRKIESESCVPPLPSFGVRWFTDRAECVRKVEKATQQPAVL
ncbi:tRNA-dihydrouridine(16/17) synthase [NAD(P)(+)]-like protein [Chytriomyces hyalinus]|nr:tRNA-dihydrouridine(16/17) synthase [NAD(P)(+)]-like protein [Chytriomyces hyalinus]